jgi:hypothetical protein
VIRVDKPEGGADLEMEIADGDLSRKWIMGKVTVSVGGDSTMRPRTDSERPERVLK